jgi:hypothetical protein
MSSTQEASVDEMRAPECGRCRKFNLVPQRPTRKVRFADVRCAGVSRTHLHTRDVKTGEGEAREGLRIVLRERLVHLYMREYVYSAPMAPRWRPISSSPPPLAAPASVWEV